VDEYLKRQNEIVWEVNQEQFKDIISIGDEVYIWRSDGKVHGSGGIVAKGTITTPVQEMEDDALDLWSDRPANPVGLRVGIHVSEVRLTEAMGG
jgi:hypothetical protein